MAKDRKCAKTGMFSVLEGREGGGVGAEHEKRARNGAFFVFEGQEWQRNIHTHETCHIRCVSYVWMDRIRAEHKKCAILGAFFVFHNGGGVENFPNTKNTPMRVCSSCLEGRDGGARRGGILVDTKKK